MTTRTLSEREIRSIRAFTEETRTFLREQDARLAKLRSADPHNPRRLDYPRG